MNTGIADAAALAWRLAAAVRDGRGRRSAAAAERS
jgi:2-polyprenyl-6-methoxyphenol hydroxylase-like FAD-dependent oxidoreductase